MTGLVVIGAGGHATSCADVARSAGYETLAFVDAGKAGGRLLGFPVVATVEEAQALAGTLEMFIAIGDNFVRARVAGELAAAHPGARFPALRHSAAYVSPFAAVAEGTVVMAGAVIGAQTRVGRFCIVNTRASLDHDNRLADFASVAPGATCGGGVSLGERSAISIGASVRHGVTIGADTVVGAQAYVHRGAPERVVVYGAPARVVRTRQPGDRYL